MAVRQLLETFRNNGGRPLFVGGWVRDRLLGIHSKDVDIEVFNLSWNQVRKLCRKHGRLITVGAAFAVLKLTLSTGEIVDISLPRREKQTGTSHRSFVIQADPHMTPEDAAQRRDLTINALSMDPFTGDILDPVGGCQDLKNRILRHVGPRFSEDPLRVLRVYRFQALLDFTIASETREICRRLAAEGSLKTLAGERIEEELRKMILLGARDATFAALKNMHEDGVTPSLYPELAHLGAVEQDPRYHAEGDVLEHTFLTMVEAAEISRRDRLPSDQAWALCLAAMVHDLGKADTTHKQPNGRITSYGHDKAGLRPAEHLLVRLTGHTKTREIVLALVAHHMRPLQLATAGKVSDSAIRRLSVSLQPATITLLSKLVEADTRASIRADGSEPENAHLFLMRRAKTLGIDRAPPRPIIRGRDLIVLSGKGVIPEQFSEGGPHFAEVLQAAYQQQLNGTISSREQAVAYVKQLCKNRNRSVPDHSDGCNGESRSDEPSI